MEPMDDLTPVLDFLDPSDLTYSQWVQVGMGLKESGYGLETWDQWSRRDSRRYHPGECERKWDTFGAGTGEPVTVGTVIQMAMDRGFSFRRDHELAWEDEIGSWEKPLVDVNWVEGHELHLLQDWNPAGQLIRYLETLFEPEERVGYVTQTWEKDGKFFPTKGCSDRTAGQLIDALSACHGDLGAVLGDYNPQAGAWIRFNPLDGQGVKNQNVTDFRYALVESDSMELEKQNALIREMELPVAALVYSGGKSLHAIVKIQADTYEEYRRRVDYLYTVCRKNGLEIDQQNRNPSRLSRMPGVIRGENQQILLDTNIGKSSWAEWKEWVEESTDDLPDTEDLATVWDNLPELSPPLIAGILRQGHKMLLAGPSKAGKSFALIELCISIAEGKPWLGFPCTQGKVLYVNLELDRASCLHRFRDVYDALGWPAANLQNIHIWNLRGRSVPMDKLAPKLIRRAVKKGYLAVIIDPIYKVITGDENSADQMAAFCNQFDKVCTELGCAVIYCHHHSKGAQGGKRSMDRASGSGVFARDPDALLDLIELEVTDSLRTQEENKAVCKACEEALQRMGFTDYSQDDACSAARMKSIVQKALSVSELAALENTLAAVKKAAQQRTAWRIEGTLREFPKFSPINLWFDFPVHRPDDSGALGDLEADDGLNSKNSPWQKNFHKQKTPEERKKERADSIETAFEACSMGADSVAISDLADYTGTTEKTVRKRLKEHGGFWVDDGNTGRKSPKGREIPD